jgi:hypothetical protein
MAGGVSVKGKGVTHSTRHLFPLGASCLQLLLACVSFGAAWRDPAHVVV